MNAVTTPSDPSPQETPMNPPNAQPVADLSMAPLPTPQTLRRRQSIPIQLSRFAVFNARIMRMVLKGDH